MTPESSPRKVCTIPMEIVSIKWNKMGSMALMSTDSKSYLIQFDMDSIENATKSDKPFVILKKFEKQVSSALFCSNYLLIVINNTLECILVSDVEDLERTQILPYIDGRLLYSPDDASIVTIKFDSRDMPQYIHYKINFDMLKFKQGILGECVIV